MTAEKEQHWTACPHPKVGDTLKWREPLWAAPNKPRGKPDQIGEQEIIAQLVRAHEVLEFKVIAVEKTSTGDAPLKVKKDDMIKRKDSTLEKGNVQKLIS